MLQTTLQKIMVVVVVAIVILALGYFLFTSASPSTSTELTGGEAYGQDILVLAEKVNSINIDQSIFKSNVFASLIDHEIPLSVEEQGRVNPFAGFGNVSSQQKVSIKVSP